VSGSYTGPGAVRFTLTAAEDRAADAVARTWLEHAGDTTLFEPAHGDSHAKRTQESARARWGLARCLGRRDGTLPEQVRVRYIKMAKKGHLKLGRKGDRPGAWFADTGRDRERAIVGWVQWDGEPRDFSQQELRPCTEFPGWVGPGKDVG
jgi:hypothetical protein